MVLSSVRDINRMWCEGYNCLIWCTRKLILSGVMNMMVLYGVGI